MPLTIFGNSDLLSRVACFLKHQECSALAEVCKSASEGVKTYYLIHAEEILSKAIKEKKHETVVKLCNLKNMTSTLVALVLKNPQNFPFALSYSTILSQATARIITHRFLNY